VFHVSEMFGVNVEVLYNWYVCFTGDC